MKIVFPEGLDERVLAAAGRLAEDQVLTPILIGNIEEIQAKAKELNVSLEVLKSMIQQTMLQWMNLLHHL